MADTIETLMQAPSMSQPVTNCARCKGNHEQIVFKKFDIPIEVIDEGKTVITFSHHGICPTSQDVILLTFKEDDSEDKDAIIADLRKQLESQGADSE